MRIAPSLHNLHLVRRLRHGLCQHGQRADAGHDLDRPGGYDYGQQAEQQYGSGDGASGQKLHITGFRRNCYIITGCPELTKAGAIGQSSLQPSPAG
ncbi:hypothetical protein MNKW57_03200 [Biformimicrobium ophioploci]|uniref:Uncharacterized protein n=1 Tax=Biformimicrobium ophioploci TaxID=3036711 RepID=A0ABQ6LV97_9GAMM|nr:hypothetical protein MNKW57_03200 [Microbulbifer sp. NKW57]